MAIVVPTIAVSTASTAPIALNCFSITPKNSYWAAGRNHVSIPVVGQLLQFGVDVPSVEAGAGAVGGVGRRFAASLVAVFIEDQLFDYVAAALDGRDLDGLAVVVVSVLVGEVDLELDRFRFDQIRCIELKHPAGVVVVERNHEGREGFRAVTIEQGLGDLRQWAEHVEDVRVRHKQRPRWILRDPEAGGLAGCVESSLIWEAEEVGHGFTSMIQPAVVRSV